MGMRHGVLAGVTLAALAMLVNGALAQPWHLSIGIQESGTAQWEITAIENLGLAEAHDVELELRYVADSRAGQIALQSGAVDVILSDFVWVSGQRHRGNSIAIVPHSLAVGALMARPDSGIAGIEDLPGRTIAVAGGPVDKSWIALQAYYHQETEADLADRVDARYGAPPLINELLASGQADAALNYWHWNARAATSGAVEVITVPEMLSGMNIPTTPPLLGWAFFDATAEAKPEALRAFLDASFDAKSALLQDDAVWEDLRPLMGAGNDNALFAALRDGYRAGIVTGYDPDDLDAAQATFSLLAKHGGSELVGDVPILAPGTFWAGYRR